MTVVGFSYTCDMSYALKIIFPYLSINTLQNDTSRCVRYWQQTSGWYNYEDGHRGPHFSPLVTSNTRAHKGKSIENMSVIYISLATKSTL